MSLADKVADHRTVSIILDPEGGIQLSLFYKRDGMAFRMLRVRGNDGTRYEIELPIGVWDCDAMFPDIFDKIVETEPVWSGAPREPE